MEISPRQNMPLQEAKNRIKNFEEVALGYTKEQAVFEAKRCLNCPKPLCIKGCPVEVPIPQFIDKLKEGNFEEAISIIKTKNNLPAICGRVCPQETQCEIKCVLAKKFEPVAIGRLERFVSDWEITKGLKPVKKASPLGKKAAVVGAGPAGLTCAGDLARMGYEVTIFEALHKEGGVLSYGIPAFRLPKEIIEIEAGYIKSLGVEILTNVIIGKTLNIDELFKEGYLAVFIGIGAGAPLFMNIPGENYNGVYSANEFLTRVNLMKAYKFPKYDTPVKAARKVAVIGGGNVAMDACRTALRLGAEKVYCVYRRSLSEMPARREEVEHAEEEGIEFQLLSIPIKIIGENACVKSLECQKMELGEPDETGRRRPIPVKGSEFILEVDMIVVAIGTQANPIIAQSTPDLKINSWGYILADPETGNTSKSGVYAGGDIVTGAATVIEAMGAGKKSAKAIHQYLSN